MEIQNMKQENLENPLKPKLSNYPKTQKDRKKKIIKESKFYSNFYLFSQFIQ